MKCRIFYASDVHGSEKVFRKFLGAAKFYKANAIIMGGDITGKLIIPIINNGDGTYRSHFEGTDLILKNKEECGELEKTIRYTGYYPYYTDPDQMKKFDEDKTIVDKLFSELMIKSLESWIELAETTLRSTEIKCFVMPGNDDRLDIDQVFEGSDVVIQPEGKVCDVDGFHEMISTGYANITPWNAPRDIPEDELATRIEKMTSQVNDFGKCIFNFHCPPYNSGLDVAPRLDETFKPVSTGGQYEMVPVGSKAVRQAIEKCQPMLGLHGHIHESRGVVKIGNALCMNAGSEYSEGILRGVLVNLDGKKISSHQMTSG